MLFALAHFLRGQQASALWDQLVAEGGRVNRAIWPNLLRHDLRQLNPAPVLCFDEVDLLRPDELQAHAQLLAALGHLRGECACLFIGQQPLVEVDAPIT